MCKYKNIHSKLSGYVPDDFWLALPFNSTVLYRTKNSSKYSDWRKLIVGVLYLKQISITSIADGLNLNRTSVYNFLRDLDNLLEVEDQKLEYILGRMETARKIRVFS